MGRLAPGDRGSGRVQAAIVEYDGLLTMVKKRKLGWFGRVSASFSLAIDNSTRHSEWKKEAIDRTGRTVLEGGQGCTLPA